MNGMDRCCDTEVSVGGYLHFILPIILYCFGKMNRHCVLFSKKKTEKL